MTVRVLAVDDSRTIREMLKSTLSGNGFKVDLAEDGIDGLLKLSEIKPDVLITDINMPRMDGFELIVEVRKKPELMGLPILVLTTESAETLKEKARASGATGWIVKPFDDQKLVKAIHKITYQ